MIKYRDTYLYHSILKSETLTSQLNVTQSSVSVNILNHVQPCEQNPQKI